MDSIVQDPMERHVADLPLTSVPGTRFIFTELVHSDAMLHFEGLPRITPHRSHRRYICMEIEPQQSF